MEVTKIINNTKNSNMARKSTICTLLTIALILAGGFRSKACTNVIVTRGASADNSNMVSYAADSHWLYGELYFHPAANWKPGSMLQVNDWDSGRLLGSIPQVLHTYKTVGNMNEYQLIIGETTWGGREELMDPTQTTAAAERSTLMTRTARSGGIWSS